ICIHADCGSGFGRITKNLLLKYFNEVDLLEPVSHFLDAARESLSGEAVVAGSDTHKASNFFCVPLQAGLKPGGCFVIKENIAQTGFVLDKDDRSITRSDLYFKDLFRRCGLHLYKTKDQRGFPKELFAVKMYALTTDVTKRTGKSRPKQQANRPGIIH
ncbi:Alpha N-terminal protein methyltransferase 1, partial [Linum perenne]